MNNIESVENKVGYIFDLFNNINTGFINQNLEISEEKIKLKMTQGDFKREYSIERETIERILSNLVLMNEVGETTIFDKNHYETLVNFVDPAAILPFWLSREVLNVKKEDKQNNVTYEFSPISDEFLLLILNHKQLSNETREKFLRDLISNIRRRFRFNIKNSEEQFDQGIDLLSLIKEGSRKLISLKITSETPLDYSAFNSLGDAFIFNTSYNTNHSIIKRVKIDEIILFNNLSSIRKSRYSEIEPPKLTYISDLIYYYETALSTNNPHLQFISFYHILEYFYEDVYTKHLVEEIRKKIISPSFSCAKSEGIKEIIKISETAFKRRGIEYNYDEQEALKLSIAEYIDIDKLENDIKAYDSELINYYSQEVPFLNKYPVDFNAKKDVVSKIAIRIYQVRNSVIHSKKGKKTVCMPFKHDKALTMEIPLIRLIAEQIIINTSKIIDLKGEQYFHSHS